jgi:hypothetical protein
LTDDNTAYIETAAWLAYKSGSIGHSVEAEQMILREMISLEDPRIDVDRTLRLHNPYGTETAMRSRCQTCDLRLFRAVETTSGWRVIEEE